MIKTIGLMPRRPDLTRAQFRAHYETRHAPLACTLFPFHRYVRNHLANQSVEPGFDCLSEFWFDGAEGFAPIAALMAGPAGATMQADEALFLDKPATRAAIATPVLIASAPATAVRLLVRDGGVDTLLIEALRSAGAGLDLLTPLDARGLPADALAWLSDTQPVTLPDGWRGEDVLRIERCETDQAAFVVA